MNLKLIGAEPGRTGTMSFRLALEYFGYAPCLQVKVCHEIKEQTKWFLEAANGKSVDWHSIFNGFEAAIDWPANAYHAELLKSFPEAKK